MPLSGDFFPSGPSVGKLALPFSHLYNRKSLLSFLLFLRDSHFNCPTPNFIVVVPCCKSGSGLLHAF